MDSPGHSHGHLEATPGREVVYCHACSNEWYRVDYGLICPDCNSEATEIVCFISCLLSSCLVYDLVLTNTVSR